MEMEYFAVKMTAQRTEEALRMQRNLDLVRQEQAVRESRRPVWRPSLTERIAKWTAAGVRRWTRYGGAA